MHRRAESGLTPKATAALPQQLWHCSFATAALPQQLCHNSPATSALPQQLCHRSSATTALPQPATGSMQQPAGSNQQAACSREQTAGNNLATAEISSPKPKCFPQQQHTQVITSLTVCFRFPIMLCMSGERN